MTTSQQRATVEVVHKYLKACLDQRRQALERGSRDDSAWVTCLRARLLNR
jgi:hypothetical protein